MDAEAKTLFATAVAALDSIAEHLEDIRGRLTTLERAAAIAVAKGATGFYARKSVGQAVFGDGYCSGCHAPMEDGGACPVCGPGSGVDDA